MTGDDEGTIVAAFRSGDPGALAEVYSQWSALVFTFALRSLGEQRDAEDVTQKVFVAAWRSRDGFDPDRGPLPVWLVDITRHSISEAVAARVRLTELRQRLEQGDSAVSDMDLGDRLLIADELHHLPAEAREVARLALFDGVTHVQIADRLGLPLGTVKSHIRLSLARMQDRIGVSNATREP